MYSMAWIKFMYIFSALQQEKCKNHEIFLRLIMHQLRMATRSESSHSLNRSDINHMIRFEEKIV